MRKRERGKQSERDRERERQRGRGGREGGSEGAREEGGGGKNRRNFSVGMRHGENSLLQQHFKCLNKHNCNIL